MSKLPFSDIYIQISALLQTMPRLECKKCHKMVEMVENGTNDAFLFIYCMPLSLDIGSSGKERILLYVTGIVLD
jgi:hypothetical protein